MIEPARGDIWWCDSPTFGRRPVVVLSRDRSIERMNQVLVAPLTTTIRGIPTEVVLEPGDDPVGRISAVNLDSVSELPKSLLVDYLGRLHHVRMREVCDALKVAVDCA